MSNVTLKHTPMQLETEHYWLHGQVALSCVSAAEHHTAEQTEHYTDYTVK